MSQGSVEFIARLAAGFGLVRNALARLQSLDLTDPTAADAACYRLVVAVEGATDVGVILLADRGSPAPESYPDVFLSLARAGLISVGLADQLATLARLRDRLVHTPTKVTDTELAAGIDLAGQSLPEFLRAVGRFFGTELGRWE